jgi:hypothetical protein
MAQETVDIQPQGQSQQGQPKQGQPKQGRQQGQGRQQNQQRQQRLTPEERAALNKERLYERIKGLSVDQTYNAFVVAPESQTIRALLVRPYYLLTEADAIISQSGDALIHQKEKRDQILALITLIENLTASLGEVVTKGHELGLGSYQYLQAQRREAEKAAKKVAREANAEVAKTTEGDASGDITPEAATPARTKKAAAAA